MGTVRNYLGVFLNASSAIGKNTYQFGNDLDCMDLSVLLLKSSFIFGVLEEAILAFHLVDTAGRHVRF